MTPIQESYRKVPYDLRECKQVERRMLIDAFMALAAAGFPISSYQYTGMGSVYFFDFMLFHRYLGISKMLSVEISPHIKKRVEFNRPFALVRTQIDEIGNVIPTLSPDLAHILWLDYDSTVAAEYLQDVISALSVLPRGSVVLITVDVEPPKSLGSKKDGPDAWREYFYREAEQYLPRDVNKSSFARSALLRLNIDILSNAISRGMRARSSVEFLPMFNFTYRDGHKMLTLGGMIAGIDERRKVQASGLVEAIYYRSSFKPAPFDIVVPRFTRRERMCLDQAMPSPDDWLPHEFEARPEDVKAYQQIYRFLPQYAELIV
jgi:hypothetical protein